MLLTHRRTIQRFRDLDHVHDHGLDAVAFALNLGDDLRHLITIEIVLKTAIHVHRHDGGSFTNGGGGPRQTRS